jgi:multiple sugar transport system substrate-binding protein
MRNRKRLVGTAAIAVCAPLVAAACGTAGGGAATSKAKATAAATITVAYELTPPAAGYGPSLQAAKAEFLKAYPKDKVILDPINATESLYYTKLALQERSPSTAPDVLVEDSFQIAADSAANNIIPIDKYLSSWKPWTTEFTSAAHSEAQGPNGEEYGVPISTDTRGLWYNKKVFKEAGIPTPWQPKDWADILSAAEKIKASVPGVIPFNINATKALGEATSLQGEQMLMSGTPQGDNGTLYNPATKKFIGNSVGLLNTLKFYQTVADKGLGESLNVAENADNSTTIYDQQFPQNKLGISLDGNWIYSNWLSKAKGGTYPWPQWSSVIGWAAMPTEFGQPPKYTSESGGWVYSISGDAKNPAAAFQFITYAANQPNLLSYDIGAGDIPTRTDVINDPAYDASDASAKFFGDLTKYTHYRPKNTNYTTVSLDLAQAAETVYTKSGSPQSAMSTFATSIKNFLPSSQYDAGSS